MMSLVDKFLDRITMYRLVLYYLIALVGIAALLAFFGIPQYNALNILFSAGLITLACWVTNKIFALVFEAPANIESVYITALILALIVTPPTKIYDIPFLLIVSMLAIASKYILAINKKHIFNPAAIAVVLTALFAKHAASWWIGNPKMLPFVIIGGLLVVRKVRRFEMVTSFLITAFVVIAALTLVAHGNMVDVLQKTVFESAVFYFAFVMLTEPLTSPPTAKKQIMYGVLIGLLFPPQVHFGRIFLTPEIALVIGNIFAYFISPKLKILPRLTQMVPVSPDIADFVFTTDRPIKYKPGQYMEWTLPHKGADSRGNRRYFTLASSPTEDNLRLGIKFYPNGSSYKDAMLEMDGKTLIAAGGLSGDFVLPKNPKQKVAFIAGGIGVTPFRSMIKYLVDTDQPRSVTLLYAEKNRGELAYTDVFEEARQKIGVKTVYALSEEPGSHAPNTYSGFIDAELLKTEVPDYLDRLFYISGSHSLVTSMKDQLQRIGVSSKNIKTDFFPGYA